MNRRGFFGMLCGVATSLGLPVPKPKPKEGWQAMDRGIFLGDAKPVVFFGDAKPGTEGIGYPFVDKGKVKYRMKDGSVRE